MELALGEHYGKGDAGKAAAGAKVHNLGSGLEVDDLGNAKRVEDVVLIEVVNVLAGDDVDFGVPIVIQLVELLELGGLFGGEVLEIFLYQFHNYDVCSKKREGLS